jgi:hypothetical protein
VGAVVLCVWAHGRCSVCVSSHGHCRGGCACYSCDYKKRENTKQSMYTTLSRSVFCKIRIQDFTDRLQGSGFYRKQILTAVCTLFSVLVFCNMKRPCITKNKKGLVLPQSVIWGVLVHLQKGLVLQFVIWEFLVRLQKGLVLQFVIWGFLVHLQKGLVLKIVIWGFLVHGVRITGVRFVTRTNPDCHTGTTMSHRVLCPLRCGMMSPWPSRRSGARWALLARST